ncbi:hypothetical protein RND71_038251 [Anisodus tanguticus]|uniref:Uncharacterized protein n=1 Tax=Anisodus tanguticus TaxID=243964 RepID=A0AAE1QZB9_9SOLA|nr:hypothetical protein RND71_038251 [Anisodus tanguticus]
MIGGEDDREEFYFENELVSENVAFLKNTEEYGKDEQEQPTNATAKLSVSSGTPLANKSKRAKQYHVGEMATLLRGGMDHLASAINRLSTLPPIPESEIWKMINDKDLEQTIITRVITSNISFSFTNAQGVCP